jgi:poly(hydroxyalkanoate) depolymerase family esterase
MPLVVALHGCTETADQFSQLTGLDQLAEARGFIVVYPEQSQAANYIHCWNWFAPADQSRGAGEPALIAGVTQQVAQRYGADRSRIYVTGLSAGGAMSAVMGATYPDLYAAIGVGSGCEYVGGIGCLSGSGADPTVAGRTASQAMGAAARPVPAIVFQGDADTTVPPQNADALVRQWQVTADIADDGSLNGSVPSAASSVAQGQVPGGRAYTVTTYSDAHGRELEQQWVVHGMGHAWSGGCACQSYADPQGPGESQAMYEFFMRHPMTPATASAGSRPAPAAPAPAAPAGQLPNSQEAPAVVPATRPARPLRMQVRHLRAVRVGGHPGVRVSFVVPRGARLVRVQLLRGNRGLLTRTVRAGSAGSRQAVELGAVRRTGGLRVAVSAGGSRSSFDSAVREAVAVG